MIHFLLAFGLTLISLLLPALYASVLIIITAVFGNTYFIHAAVCAVFFLISLCTIMIFMKRMQKRNEENTDGEE